MLKITLDKAAIDRLIGDKEWGQEIELELFKAVQNKLKDILRDNNSRISTAANQAFNDAIMSGQYYSTSLNEATKKLINQEAHKVVLAYLSSSDVLNQAIDKIVGEKIDKAIQRVFGPLLAKAAAKGNP